MSKATITVEGFVANDPRDGQHNGDAWLSFSVPHTPRRFDKDKGEYVDTGETLWVQVTLWRDDAQRFTDHLRKGTQVRVEGEPVLRAWESNGKSGVNLEVKFPCVSIVPPKGQAPASTPDVWNTPQGGGNSETAYGAAFDAQFGTEVPF